MMIDKYQAVKKRNERVARLAKARRAQLLETVPETFMAKDLVAGTGLTIDTISAQIQKMIKHKEVTQNSAYSKPRIYTKVKHEQCDDRP
jgi:hypothetical protein